MILTHPMIDAVIIGVVIYLGGIFIGYKIRQAYEYDKLKTTRA